MDGIVNLTPDDPRAREAIVNLLGTTLSELKEIDKNVVGGSRNISALKTDLKNVFNFQQPSQITSTTNTVVQPPAQSQVQPSVLPLISPPEDPNQLIFDFNQKITPNTINDKLDRILDKLDRIISTICSK